MSFTFEEFPNSDFYNSDLRQILVYVRKLIEGLDSLEHWRATHEYEYAELKALTDDINSRLTQIENGDFPESLYNAMRNWWEANAVDLVGNLVKFVFFGLTLDGYFVAYIPENWNEIDFDTIVVPGDNYGKLCILY